MSNYTGQANAAEQESSSKLRLALEKLVPHVMHYASMPHAHSDAHRDAADARQVLEDCASGALELNGNVSNYIEQPHQPGGVLVNKRLLDALRLAEKPLIRLGDFVGNVDKGGASGLGDFDRCAIVLEVRSAIAEAEKQGDQMALVRAIPDADLLAEINRRGMLQPLYGAIGAMHDHLDRTGALDERLSQYLAYRLRREEAAITGMPDSPVRVANWQECIDQLDCEARAVKAEDSPSPGM